MATGGDAIGAKGPRVVCLVAGAGGMYCGSCMRDNRLAATWIRQGRDVSLVPLYTPIRTDEADVSEHRVYYGGINAYLQQKSSLFRRTPWFVDRVLDAPALLRGVGRLAAKTKAEELGALTVSVLEGAAGRQRKELDKLIVALRDMQPTLVMIPNLMFVGVVRDLKEALRCPVLCELAGEDIFLDALPSPFRERAFELIRRGANDVAGFVAPTRYYAEHAAGHFGLDRELIRYAPMGIRANDWGDAANAATAPFTIGYLARICPEKGFDVVCDAFARLRASGRTCRLRVGGYLGAADRAYFDAVWDRLHREGHGGAIEHVGEVTREQKIELLRSLHVLSVPAPYRESKGFYVLEAMACGVPVVQPRHGAFTELVEATGGGLLYDPADATRLDRAIEKLMDDEDLRIRLAAAGRKAVRESFTDEVMASATWAIIEEFCR